MKMKIGLLAAAAIVVLAGFARAEDSDKFLVRGEASKVLMEQNQINIVTAEAIGKACVEEAVKQGVRISIVILIIQSKITYFDDRAIELVGGECTYRARNLAIDAVLTKAADQDCDAVE